MRAFASYKFEEVTPGVGPDSFIVPVTITYTGSDLPPARNGVDFDRVDVTLPFTDTLQAMQGKVVDAIMARAGVLGYSLNRNGILLTSMNKGS
jgi:hypothetical protein